MPKHHEGRYSSSVVIAGSKTVTTPPLGMVVQPNLPAMRLDDVAGYAKGLDWLLSDSRDPRVSYVAKAWSVCKFELKYDLLVCTINSC